MNNQNQNQNQTQTPAVRAQAAKTPAAPEKTIKSQTRQSDNLTCRKKLEFSK